MSDRPFYECQICGLTSTDLPDELGDFEVEMLFDQDRGVTKCVTHDFADRIEIYY